MNFIQEKICLLVLTYDDNSYDSLSDRYTANAKGFEALHPSNRLSETFIYHKDKEFKPHWCELYNDYIAEVLNILFSVTSYIYTTVTTRFNNYTPVDKLRSFEHLAFKLSDPFDVFRVFTGYENYISKNCSEFEKLFEFYFLDGTDSCIISFTDAFGSEVMYDIHSIEEAEQLFAEQLLEPIFKLFTRSVRLDTRLNHPIRNYE